MIYETNDETISLLKGTMPTAGKHRMKIGDGKNWMETLVSGGGDMEPTSRVGIE